MKNHTTINTIPSSEHDIRVAGHTDIEKVCQRIWNPVMKIIIHYMNDMALR